jgi:hypothetical protein
MAQRMKKSSREYSKDKEMKKAVRAKRIKN